MHGGRVPQGVRRDVLAAKRRAVVFGCGDRAVEAVANPGAGERGAGPVREGRAVGVAVDLVEPAAELGGGVLPEWDGALLATLAVEQNRRLTVQQDVTDS